MDSDWGTDDFKRHVIELYKKLNSGEMDYFNLLGLSRTAISRDIEQAYQRLSAEFSPDRIENLVEPELKQKARMISAKIKRAHEVIGDYEQRGKYEERGFREPGPQDEKEEDPVEVAKTLFRKAKTLYGRQDYTTAIPVIEKAIQLDSGKADYYYLLGVCQSKLPALKRDGEKNLLKAAEIEPWNAEHDVALGMLFYSERLFNRAESHFRQALSKDPGQKLARTKLEEIAGPEKTTMDSLKEGLQKVFPTIFGKKKK